MRRILILTSPTWKSPTKIYIKKGMKFRGTRVGPSALVSYAILVISLNLCIKKLK
jgi:hypothetical protein